MMKKCKFWKKKWAKMKLGTSWKVFTAQKKKKVLDFRHCNAKYTGHISIIWNGFRHYILFRKKKKVHMAPLQFVFDLHLLSLRIGKTHRDKTVYDSISIKMHSCTWYSSGVWIWTVLQKQIGPQKQTNGKE